VTPEGLLLEVLTAAAEVDAEPGDGFALFMPDGEELAIFKTEDGIGVRRNATDGALMAFLMSDAPEAAFDVAAALEEAACTYATLPEEERERHRVAVDRARFRAAEYLVDFGNRADAKLAARFLLEAAP
jgi:hypothetical protein